jgi:hypothetical protein
MVTPSAGLSLPSPAVPVPVPVPVQGAPRARAGRAAAGTLHVVRVLVAPDPRSIVAVEVPQLQLDHGGVVGDRHHGTTRRSGSREARFYPRGTVIRNRRQVSLVSVEELAEVAERLGLAAIRPEWLGANLLVAGFPQLSALPLGARILLPGGVGLVCEGVNQPCRLPARVLDERFPGAGRGFVRAAYGRRGIVASVERPGVIDPGAAGDIILPELHVYSQ